MTNYYLRILYTDLSRQEQEAELNFDACIPVPSVGEEITFQHHGHVVGEVATRRFSYSSEGHVEVTLRVKRVEIV
jgi:hypothetical protein